MICTNYVFLLIIIYNFEKVCKIDVKYGCLLIFTQNWLTVFGCLAQRDVYNLD